MKYIIAIITVIIIAFLGIFLLIGGRDSEEQADIVRLSDLADTGLSVTMTIEGNVTGDDTRQAVRIVVDSRSRSVDLLSGFNQAVEKSASFENNMTAFKTFLSALDNMGFTNSQTPQFSDSRGVCPFGNVFKYAYTTADGHTSELWSSSCGIRTGTFYGNGSGIRRLFQAQITDYDEFMRGVTI